MTRHYCLIVISLLAFASRAVSQTEISLPARDEIARITIDSNPLRLYTTDSLLETLPCFTPAERGSIKTPERADRGLIELKNGGVVNWFAADFRTLLIQTRAGSRLFELSSECAYRRQGPYMRLHRYVFSKSDFPEPLPKRIERGVVERFLREVLSWTQPGELPASQIRQLALFYDAQSVVPDFLKRLDAMKAAESELQASVIFTEVVGLIGDDAQREAGLRYYRHLLTVPYKKGPVLEMYRLRALTNALNAYTPEESSDGLLMRIDRALARLRPLARNDWGAGIEMREIEDLRNVVVYRVRGAAAMKQEIMQKADAASRLDALVNIYLDVDARYSEFVEEWALHKIVRAGRTDSAPEVIDAFRRAVKRLPRESLEARRARALHAVEFFGGRLTPAERAQTRPEQGRFEPLSLYEMW